MKTIPRGAYLCVLDVVKKAVAETWDSRESAILPTTMFHADLEFSGVDLLKLDKSSKMVSWVLRSRTKTFARSYRCI